MYSNLSMWNELLQVPGVVMDFSSLPLDQSGEYRLQRFFLRPKAESQKRQQDVTLVTHCTTNHLHNLLDVSRHWQGPIALGENKQNTKINKVTVVFRGVES